MFEKNPLKRSAGAPVEPQEAAAPAPSGNIHVPKTPSYERATGTATIGPSINIKGELSGEEDLVIQGNVEGAINLKHNNLTIGQEGKVNANIQAHTSTVEGTLKGDIFGDEMVIIKKSGNVHGNVSAPRISLEDGAKLKGSVDMDHKRSAAAAPEPRNDKAPASVFKLDNNTPPAEKKASFEKKDAVT
jgi:cytoskeletal protein CcmA (bactofilin family)